MPWPVLHLREIPPEGLSFSCDIRGEDLALDPEDGLIPWGLALDLRAVKAGGVVYVTGTVSGIVRRQCVRCLAEYDDALQLALVGEYHREAERRNRPVGPDRQPAVFEEADDQVYFYAGNTIELAAMVREQVILAAPIKPLCRTDCQGLCPTCGQDLNVGRCACLLEPAARPFAGLKTLCKQIRPSTHLAKKE
jgi:uncharacterized protein